MERQDDHNVKLTRTMSGRDDEMINLLDYWVMIIKHKRLIGYMVGGAIVLSVALSLLLPKAYEATASILPPQPEVSLGLSSLLGEKSGGSGMAGSMVKGLLGEASPTDVWVGILNSQTARDALIEHFHLRDLYKKDTIEETRKALDKHVTIKKSDEEIIALTVEDEDPKLAAAMANALVGELDRINRETMMTSGKRMRVFVEGRLKEAKEELAKAEDKLKDFQEKNGAVKLDAQSKAVIESIGLVKGQLMAKEVELQTFLSYASTSNPKALMLKSEIQEIKERLKELDSGQGTAAYDPTGVYVPTQKMPDLALRYGRFLRDVMVQETLLQLLIQQYDMARMQEAKDSPTVQVLDVAKVPEKESKPNKPLIVIVMTFGTFCLSVLYAIVRENFRTMQLPPALIERSAH